MPLRLSEAIRLGAMMKPQATGGILGRNGGTCALGAAMDAVGEPLTGYWGVVADRWSVARQYVTYPGAEPAYKAHPLLVLSCCWILNDAEKWTREDIADWVETIEATVPSGEGHTDEAHVGHQPLSASQVVVGVDR